MNAIEVSKGYKYNGNFYTTYQRAAEAQLRSEIQALISLSTPRYDTFPTRYPDPVHFISQNADKIRYILIDYKARMDKHQASVSSR